MGLWVALLGMDEVWKFGRITEEEDWGVVGYHIPIALCSSELDREPSRVSSTVGRSGFATHSREANGDRTGLASLTEDVSKAYIVDRVRAFECAVSAASLGVDDTLWDPLSVEM